MTKYYEVAPNIEVISNQSHSFYFPPMVAISTLLDIKYKSNSQELINRQEVLDYTLIGDEDCINLQMLFSEHPKNNATDNIVQFLRSEGIFPVKDHIRLNTETEENDD